MARNRRRDEQVHSTLTLFMLAHLALAGDADAELAKQGLTRTHHRILYLVIHGPGMTVGGVGEVLRLTPQAVQAPLRRLLDEGLIERRASTEDRRRRHLYPTAKGKVFVRFLSKRQADRISRVFGAVPANSAQQFREMLAQLADPRDLLWAHRSIDLEMPEAPTPARTDGHATAKAAERMAAPRAPRRLRQSEGQLGGKPFRPGERT